MKTRDGQCTAPSRRTPPFVLLREALSPTLLGDCRKGRRPSFVGAAQPEAANRLYERFVERVRGHGVRTQTGRFGAMMQVDLVNDGPVTLVLESAS